MKNEILYNIYREGVVVDEESSTEKSGIIMKEGGQRTFPQIILLAILLKTRIDLGALCAIL